MRQTMAAKYVEEDDRTEVVTVAGKVVVPANRG